MAKGTAILRPNFGLYLDRAPLTAPNQAVVDGMNFRVRNGSLSDIGLGYTRFGSIQLDGPVKFIERFARRDGVVKNIIGTPTSLYSLNYGAATVAYLNPRYETGTIAVSNANPAVVTGTGTSFVTAGIKAGDKVYIGASGRTDPSGTWYTVGSVTDNTHLTLTTSVPGTPLSGQSYTIVRIFQANTLTHWSTQVFINDAVSGDDLWMATNGLDWVISWNGDADQVTLNSALGFTCQKLIVYSSMMIYLNLVQSGDNLPTDMINSDVGSPLDVAGGLSEQFRVHAGADAVIDAELLADNLVIYSQRGVHLCQFVGDPLIFAFRRAVAGVGPVAYAVVANFGDYHEFLGADSMYKFDGSTLVPSATQVWRAKLPFRSVANGPLSFCFFDEGANELLWAIPYNDDPDSSQPNYAYVEHYSEQMPQNVPQPWSVRQFPFTAVGEITSSATQLWSTLSGTWEDQSWRWNDPTLFAEAPLLLAGDSAGKLYTLGAQTFNGSVINSFVTFDRRATLDGINRGLISRIYPFVVSPDGGTFNLSVTLYCADHAQGPYTIAQTDSFDISLPEGRHFTTPYRRGRFFGVSFGSSTLNATWSLAGWDREVKVGGRR